MATSREEGLPEVTTHARRPIRTSRAKAREPVRINLSGCCCQAMKRERKREGRLRMAPGSGAAFKVAGAAGRAPNASSGGWKTEGGMMGCGAVSSDLPGWVFGNGATGRGSWRGGGGGGGSGGSSAFGTPERASSLSGGGVAGLPPGGVWGLGAARRFLRGRVVVIGPMTEAGPPIPAPAPRLSCRS